MSTSFTVMTYNVHSCTGTDGKTSPERIAKVIAECGADLIALQELDMLLLRTGLADQARIIADRLRMQYHFHPSLYLEEGAYGNAILSRFPLRLIKARELPTVPGRRPLERRGALAASVQVNGHVVDLFNTHLGLNRRERRAQADELLGPQWFHPSGVKRTTVFCGDLNAPPWSRVYRRFARALFDVQRAAGTRRRRNTWPSRFPLFRFDHIFVTADIVVQEVFVPRTALTRLASDHLPVVARLQLT